MFVTCNYRSLPYALIFEPGKVNDWVQEKASTLLIFVLPVMRVQYCITESYSLNFSFHFGTRKRNKFDTGMKNVAIQDILSV